MRKGFDGLAALVQTALAANPHSGHVFVLRGRRGDIIKVLWSDGQGLLLLAKRLEKWKGRKGSLRMVAGHLGQRVAHPSAAVDAARRHRLAHARTHLAARDGGVKIVASRKQIGG